MCKGAVYNPSAISGVMLSLRHIVRANERDGSVSFESFPTEEEKKRTEEYYKALAQERINHYNRIFHLILGQEEEAIVKEVEARIEAMSEEEKKTMPESELYRKVYNEVWDGSGIEGWWD